MTQTIPMKDVQPGMFLYEGRYWYPVTGVRASKWPKDIDIEVDGHWVTFPVYALVMTSLSDPRLTRYERPDAL